MEYEFHKDANSIEILDSDDDYRVIFGKCMKKLRLLMGLSINDVANYVEIPSKTITRFENGTVSDTSFYENVDWILEFFISCKDAFFGSSIEKFDGIFDWMYLKEVYKPWVVTRNKELFERFTSRKFKFKNGAFE